MRAGDWVEVLSKDEILMSLDKKGELDGLPFMPEMFQFCGRRFKVYKSAHKTCNTVTGVSGLRLADGIHLETRCDGAAHGGCQAACLIFWKKGWLKQVRDEEPPVDAQTGGKTIKGTGCLEADVVAATCPEGQQQPPEDTRYVCQATLLPYYTTFMPWWDLRQYLEDYTSGNVTLGRMASAFIYAGYFNICKRVGSFAVPIHWIYDKLQHLLGGIPYPRRRGVIPIGQPTPTCTLDLQPGDLVRVKPFKDILATLDTANKNRGLYFDAELVPFCGNTYRVRSRITKFLDEKTGKMLTMKTATIILEDVWCQSRYSDCRLFCPRSIYTWWREIWLEKI